ncbi:PLP-dependent aminotransferase family protein [Microbulbifer sp. SSSA007]|uniref:MocR-like pyridoxine biosynthesis transcription factor PdxR n=1 Tax=Microbulbifer sp. SSSA007 TaxID=3243379 RepID=UPI004039776E
MMSIPDFNDLLIDKRKPIKEQLYYALLERIVNGRLETGSKLPSSRKMSEYLCISRSTVIRVIDLLKKEGFLTSKPCSGVFITDKLPTYAFDIPYKFRVEKFKKNTNYLPSLSNYGESQNVLAINNSPWPETLPFSPGLPDLKAFPNRAWNELYRKNIGKISIDHFSCSSGYLPLREQISKYLCSYRDLNCIPSQVIITSGALESLNLCSRVLLDPGDTVLMENPGYKRARHLFDAMNANIELVALKKKYIDIEDLSKKNMNVKLLYISPNHQYPLGGVIPIKERYTLLNWITKSNCWVIENDYQSEFLFNRKSRDTLQGLKENTPIIYAGGFSRTLMPALRLSYIVVPKEVASTFVNAKAHISGPSPSIYQAVLSDFIKEGHYIKHLREMRNSYFEKCNHFCNIISRELITSVNIISSNSPMDIVIQFKHHDDVEISEKLSKYGFGSTPISPYYYSGNKKSGLIINCANSTKSERERFISCIKNIFKN